MKLLSALFIPAILPALCACSSSKPADVAIAREDVAVADTIFIERILERVDSVREISIENVYRQDSMAIRFDSVNRIQYVDRWHIEHTSSDPSPESTRPGRHFSLSGPAFYSHIGYATKPERTPKGQHRCYERDIEVCKLIKHPCATRATRSFTQSTSLTIIARIIPRANK